MRPRIEGKSHHQVIKLIDNYYQQLSPTQLIEMLIDNHYHSLCPRGEEIIENGNTKKRTESLKK